MVRAGVIAAVFAAMTWVGCGKSNRKGDATEAGPAGTVTAISGEVTAKRGEAVARPLAMGAEVFSDDVVTTGPTASVSIAFTHGGTFELGAERQRLLADVIAKLGSMGTGGAGAEGDVTAAAGRHAEGEAAGTAATAKSEASSKLSADQPPAAPTPDDDARRAAIREQIKAQGVLKILGAKGEGSGSISDVLEGGSGDLEEALAGAGGVGVGSRGPGHGSGGGGGGSGGLGAKGGSKVGTGSPTIQGAMDPSILKRSIKTSQPKLRYCYEKELVIKPDLGKVKISLQWAIKADGTVMGAKVTSAEPSMPTLEQCVVKVFAAMKFPKPAGGGIVMVNYPVVFAPE